MKNEFFLEFEVGDYVFIVENNGTSVWGYLTEKNGDILRDVFICSPIVPEDELDAQHIKQGNPPKLCKASATETAFIENISQAEISIEHIENFAYCVKYLNEPIAAIYLSENRGFSKSLSSVCGFGNPWSEKAYELSFGNGSHTNK